MNWFLVIFAIINAFMFMLNESIQNESLKKLVKYCQVASYFVAIGFQMGMIVATK